MQIIYSSLSAVLVLAIAASAPSVHAIDFFSAEAESDSETVEHIEIQVSNYNSAIVATSLADTRNYANPDTQPICVNQVTRVREAVYNGTRDMLIEVMGCQVAEPRGLCALNTNSDNNCAVPFEVHVVGPESSLSFDPMATLREGKAVQSPYVVESIGVLL